MQLSDLYKYYYGTRYNIQNKYYTQLIQNNPQYLSYKSPITKTQLKTDAGIKKFLDLLEKDNLITFTIFQYLKPSDFDDTLRTRLYKKNDILKKHMFLFCLDSLKRKYYQLNGTLIPDLLEFADLKQNMPTRPVIPHNERGYFYRTEQSNTRNLRNNFYLEYFIRPYDFNHITVIKGMLKNTGYLLDYNTVEQVLTNCYMSQFDEKFSTPPYSLQSLSVSSLLDMTAVPEVFYINSFIEEYRAELRGDKRKMVPYKEQKTEGGSTLYVEAIDLTIEEVISNMDDYNLDDLLKDLFEK